MPLDGFQDSSSASEADLRSRLVQTRDLSLEIAVPLSPEDMAVQASDDASPTKWHLAHTTWFFEELVLKAHLPGYTPFDERFSYCFNSYYESLGDRHPRGKRGLLTRPSANEVLDYRKHVDTHLERLFERGLTPRARSIVEIGINHEQQHQELALTDILALFAENPLHPVYRPLAAKITSEPPADVVWIDIKGGLQEIGHRGGGFAYDNEGPRHRVYLDDFRIRQTAVTNGEWIAFIEAGGYDKPELWLADGWAMVKRQGWQCPLYWERSKDGWKQMTLHGFLAVDIDSPVCHVSFYEADAFARWSGYRLPTEVEWEIARGPHSEDCTFSPSHLLPRPQNTAWPSGVWEWTQSAYLPYPGYKPEAGPLGEYNGKFMCNQFVLRGGSVATPPGHIRTTYRNFFYPHQRWQFTGVRLASGV